MRNIKDMVKDNNGVGMLLDCFVMVVPPVTDLIQRSIGLFAGWIVSFLFH